MRRERLNVWPAFTDMVFVLFVCTLCASWLYQQQTQDVKDELDSKVVALTSAQERIEQLEQNQRICADAGVFWTGLSDCAKSYGKSLTPIFDATGCQAAFPSIITFDHGQSTLEGEKEESARVFAECLFTAQDAFAKNYPERYDALDHIFIDGYASCSGTKIENMDFGFRRGLSLYNLYAKEADQLGASARLTDKVAIRSFGETQGNCSNKEISNLDDEERRNVTISIHPRMDRGSDAP